MKILYVLTLLFLSNLSALNHPMWLGLEDMSDLKQIDAVVLYHHSGALVIKYQEHYYNVLKTEHHCFCPCYDYDIHNKPMKDMDVKPNRLL